MFNKNEYLVNGMPSRTKISQDIKRGILSRSDIDVLVSDVDMKNSFFGLSISENKPRACWTNEYRDTLANRVVAEDFSPSLLYHLLEVSEYLNDKQKKEKQKKKTSVIVLAILAVTIIILAILLCNRPAKQQTRDATTTPISQVSTDKS